MRAHGHAPRVTRGNDVDRRCGRNNVSGRRVWRPHWHSAPNRHESCPRGLGNVDGWRRCGGVGDGWRQQNQPMRAHGHAPRVTRGNDVDRRCGRNNVSGRRVWRPHWHSAPNRHESCPRGLGNVDGWRRCGGVGDGWRQQNQPMRAHGHAPRVTRGNDVDRRCGRNNVSGRRVWRPHWHSAPNRHESCPRGLGNVDGWRRCGGVGDGWRQQNQPMRAHGHAPRVTRGNDVDRRCGRNNVSGRRVWRPHWHSAPNRHESCPRGLGNVDGWRRCGGVGDGWRQQNQPMRAHGHAPRVTRGNDVDRRCGRNNVSGRRVWQVNNAHQPSHSKIADTGSRRRRCGPRPVQDSGIRL